MLSEFESIINYLRTTSNTKNVENIDPNSGRILLQDIKNCRELYEADLLGENKNLALIFVPREMKNALIFITNPFLKERIVNKIIEENFTFHGQLISTGFIEE